MNTLTLFLVDIVSILVMMATKINGHVKHQILILVIVLYHKESKTHDCKQLRAAQGSKHLKILRPLFLSETASNDYLEHSDCISNTFGAFLARFANFDKNSLNQ